MMKTPCTSTPPRGCEAVSTRQHPHLETAGCAPESGTRAGRVVLAAVMGLAIGAFFLFDMHSYLTLETMKANRDRLLVFTDAHRVAAAAGFFVTYCLATGLSLPGATILTLVGGFLFGGLLGTIVVNLGATAGTTLAFLMARYLLRGWVEQKFGQKLGPFNKGFRGTRSVTS